MADSKATQVFYSGHVQGVGFRHAVRRLADGHRVVGWVRNLRDGRVELWVEGNARDVAEFLSAVSDRFSECILDEEHQHPMATGEFSQFEIRH